MSPTPPTVRRRGLRALGFTLVLGAAVGLTSCQVENTPKGYETAESGTIVQTNFVAACTGNLPSEAGTTTSLAPTNQCECIYTQVTKLVPFDDADRARTQGYPSEAPTFVQLEGDLRTNPGDISKLPSSVQDAIHSCGSNQATVGTAAR